MKAPLSCFATNRSWVPVPLLEVQLLLTHTVFARVEVLQAKRLPKARHTDVHTWRCFGAPSSLIVDQSDAQNEANTYRTYKGLLRMQTVSTH